jgi:hypothetical protein
MRKTFLILLIILAYSAIAQERFSSKEYNFAISFPKDWDINNKSDTYVVEAFENNYIGISIMAIKYPRLPDSIDIGYITRDSLQKIIEEQVQKRYNKALVLYSGNGLMDGVLAYFYFIQYSDYKDGFPSRFVSFQYQFVYRGIFYSIFAVCPSNQYESYEKTFNNIYSTFRFMKKL